MARCFLVGASFLFFFLGPRGCSSSCRSRSRNSARRRSANTCARTHVPPLSENLADIVDAIVDVVLPFKLDADAVIAEVLLLATLRDDDEGDGTVEVGTEGGAVSRWTN